MDNLEWTAGFGNRYGIVSASFFRECSRRNAVA
jgi:beta-glucosidase/6-phospho-beta-glucosidase/beta-galactosidase